MSAERLREILNNVADETRPVPLEEAAMAESRRIGVRRAVVGAAAAVALLVAGVVGATTVWSDRGSAPMDPAISDSPTPDQTTTAEALKDVRLYYVRGEQLIVSVGNATSEVVLDGEPYLAETASFSPTGDRLAYVSKDGRLAVRDMETGTVEEYIDYPTTEICQAPVWSITEYELLIEIGGERGIFDLERQSFTALSFQPESCHAVLNEVPGSAEGLDRQIVYLGDDGSTLVSRREDGTVVDERDTDLGDGTRIVAVFPRVDGELDCFFVQPVGESVPEGRISLCNRVLEPGLDTSEATRPGQGEVRWTDQSFGELMVREVEPGTGVVLLSGYDEEGERLWSVPEMAGLADAQLLKTAYPPLD